VLIDKGHNVHFVLDSNERLYLPANVAMLHDPSGVLWDRNSILFAPYTKLGTPVDAEADARDYLGRTYLAHQGTVSLPPQALSRWRSVGRVQTIFYDRSGHRAPGYFKHRFQAPGVLQSAAVGALVGGLAGLFAGALVESSKLIIAGAVVGGLAGMIVSKVEFPIDPPTQLLAFGGKYWRLQLPRLSLANWRGFVLP
jgi:hypothetical protein